MKEKIEELRKKYPNCLLLFRGKECYCFYEEDAKEVVKKLHLSLNKCKKDGLYQTTILIEDLDYYKPKLLKLGKKLLLCDIFTQEYYYI